jgi:hypothetical protein
MAFDLGDALWLMSGLAVLSYWWQAQGIKARALQAVKAHCENMDVQLLDDSIVLRGFWFKRNPRGSLCIWRSYLFEFSSTGEQRYAGKIILLGPHVESVQLEPHRLH